MSFSRKSFIGTMVVVSALAFFAACDDSTSAASSEPVAEISSSSGDEAIHSSGSVDSIGSSSSVSLTDDEKSSSSVEKSNASSSSVTSAGSETLSSSSVTPTSSANAQFSSSKVDDSSASVKPKSSSSEEVKQSSSSVVASSSSVTSSETVKSSSSEYVPYNHRKALYSDSVLTGAYKQFTDTRNGRTYYYLTINGVDKNDKPASVTVMAENLNVGVMVDGKKDQSDNSNVERYCYGNDTTNCDKYGGLYQWAEMMQLPSECNTKSCADLIKPNHQGVCPEGWRLLTEDDFYIILHADGNRHGAEDVRATSFGGYNYSGYSLIGAGYNWAYKFTELSTGAYWHYPEEGELDIQIASNVGYQSNSMTANGSANAYKTHGFSVRCVMVK